MLTLIHAWIAELYELNPDMVWKLPQVAKPHALDDTDDEAIAIVENLMDVRIALYIELVQFLEKELLDKMCIRDRGCGQMNYLKWR